MANICKSMKLYEKKPINCGAKAADVTDKFFNRKQKRIHWLILVRLQLVFAQCGDDLGFS